MRWFNLLILVTLGLLLSVLPALAAVSGNCVNCHTIHNSQNGQPMTFNASGPMPTLLRANCVGCHTNSSTADTIVMLGDSRLPIVYNTIEPDYPPTGTNSSALAGGNFYWVAEQGDEFGHNVFGISGTDSKLTKAPGGGFEGSCAKCHNTLASAEAGSGCEGCHLPQHHKNDGQAGPAGQEDGWYRFLGSAMARDLNDIAPGDQPGVMGLEDPNWEQDPSSTQHNVYKGTDVIYSEAFYANHNSIGEFCQGCHYDFHRLMNTNCADLSGAWIRHPSDVILPDDAALEYVGYTTYNPLAPVAKQTLSDTPSDAVVAGEDVVTCISCHRPHGSPYPDMLRWDYLNDCTASVPDSNANPCGCFACHTTKDGI
ncbi:MAG: hypothetical protein BA864_13065 [Desulfuromonadales bacterium C00003093]|nr:MAG: hypothetical protein BA864_13065 [Desulfuromonadales bacterium C00003093]